MKNILPLLALAALPILVSAQTCPCTAQFDWLRQKLALNYSGYRDKVTPANQADFERHTADFQAKAAGVAADTACLRLMREWAQWFRDGHVQLSVKSKVSDDTAAIRARFAGWEKIVLSEARARTYFDLPDCAPVEGIYQNAEGNYRIALIRSPTPEREFAAVVLKADSVWWMPGQIKFDLKQSAPGQFTARYYMRDHSERQPAATFQAGKLEFAGLGAWYRQYPGQAVAVAPRQIFSLDRLDSATLLLRVPTMDESVRGELDSLIAANSALLDRSPNLIIDCRGNGGGSDITFYPLRPYVYTGNVKGYRGQIYATDDNLEKYERLRKNKDFPKNYRLYFGHIARKMRRHKGEFVGKCGEQTVKFKKAKPYPLRVAVLIDGDCASSCEQFVYYARQSKRVTLIGQNTAGIMDYGNLHTLESPCGVYNLAYPTSRSCRVEAGQAIDGKGLPPDVRVDEKTSDWVEFTRGYLTKSGN